MFYSPMRCRFAGCPEPGTEPRRYRAGPCGETCFSDYTGKRIKDGRGLKPCPGKRSGEPRDRLRHGHTDRGCPCCRANRLDGTVLRFMWMPPRLKTACFCFQAGHKGRSAFHMAWVTPDPAASFGSAGNSSCFWRRRLFSGLWSDRRRTAARPARIFADALHCGMLCPGSADIPPASCDRPQCPPE